MMKTTISRKKFLLGIGLGTLFSRSLFASVSGTKSKSPLAGSLLGTTPHTLLKTNVLVVGGGPAGIGAAMGAAMSGEDTFIIENYGFFGGVGAWSLGMSINQMRPESQPRSMVHEKVIDKLEAYGPKAMKMVKHGILCNVNYLKVSLLDALDDAGCKYLVHTKVVDTLIENNRVTGVVVATKNGLATIVADVVIDCTGDADVSFFAGAETLKDPEVVSPQTLALSMCNVDTDSVKYKFRMTKEMVQKSKEKYPGTPDSWTIARIANDHNFYINHAGTKVFGHFDITDPFVFTDAECKSRRQVIAMVQAVNDFGPPEFRNSEISGTGPQIGVRESRRIKGLYILTEEDAVNGSTFDDVIAWRSGAMDVGFTRYADMKTHDVPYRAILPEKTDGLLVAGRCISATHMGLSAGKSMGNCIATGHAAGIAAALSVQDKCQPRELKVDKIQHVLRKHEVDLTMGGRSQSEDAFDSI
jgi:ribulose 1,5-bisphosphate synthetase/thiazole synthase